MKKYLVSFWLLPCATAATAQEVPATFPRFEQQLENLAERNEGEVQDDSWLQQADYWQRHPLNLNEADEQALASLQVLSALQVAQFFRYRQVMGPLVNLYELQAIPGWDLATIRTVLPFVTVREKITLETLGQRFSQGEQTLLMRYAIALQKSDAFADDTTTATQYLGSRPALLLRYKYQYKNLLQFGITGDKDAGEPFFKQPQSAGFDFYSLHFFVRRMGIIKSLALGDFTVNMGQGLVQWQSLAFKKSTAAMAVKRQSDVLRPYNSTGEYAFHRGAGITLQRGPWQVTAFGSWRRFSANLVPGEQPGQQAVSSLLPWGYHRTVAEIADRNTLSCFTAGANLQYNATGSHIGVSMIRYRFSHPMQIPDKPYDLWAMQGRAGANYSVDYSYTFRNMHLFGELAADALLNKALVSGMLISLHPRADMSFVYRHISPAYRSWFANAFTENTTPVNERGFYTGLTLRPASTWQVDAYADFFRFPWLKFRVNAPSEGCEYVVQAMHMPNKQVSILARYKYENKALNVGGEALALVPVTPVIRQGWRLQSAVQFNTVVTLRNRIEWLQYKQSGNGLPAQAGLSAFADADITIPRCRVTANMRLQYFETDSYDTRIYAYESDVAYRFSVKGIYSKGIRYYVNVKFNFSHILADVTNRKIKSVAWFRFSRIHPFRGSSIEGSINPQSDISLQVMVYR